ncbi:MAG: shikimate kinase [Lachnospiraceae bacterium]|nr:shikimate kinase [Lachnospiraceae bacterium]
MKNIFLIGFMGAGKSTVARHLQKRLKMNLAEMDERIEKEQGMTIPEIFEKYGESRFRDLESELILTIGKEGNTIVSCGGGVVVRPENIEYMKKNGRVFYLKTSPETVYNRVKDSTNRPILNGNMNVEYIAGLMEKRRALYEGAADITITTDGKSVDEITDEIIIAI